MGGGALEVGLSKTIKTGERYPCPPSVNIYTLTDIFPLKKCVLIHFIIGVCVFYITKGI